MGVVQSRKRSLKGRDTVAKTVMLLQSTAEGIVRLAAARGGISQGAVLDELVEGALKRLAQHVVQVPVPQGSHLGHHRKVSIGRDAPARRTRADPSQ